MLVGAGDGRHLDNQHRALQTCSHLNADGMPSTRSKPGDESKERETAAGVAERGRPEGAEEGSAAEEEGEEADPLVAKYDETGKPLSNWTRMKMLVKAYGYVIIPVHWVIAPVWFGAFYYTVKM